MTNYLTSYLISYDSCPTRGDGVPLDLTRGCTVETGECTLSSDSEDEVVIGRGFAYESDSEIENGPDGVDDFDAIVGDTEDDEKVRPDQFATDHPLSATIEACRVSLYSGQCLYLPASWFHCVSSFADSEKGEEVHLALNYWYHPPDGDCFESPYKDTFWPDRQIHERKTKS